MSLTSQLDRRSSPVRDFFEFRFPAAKFKALSKPWYEVVRAADVICPPPDGVNPGTIGTTFDYRARLCWAPIDWAATVAAGGALHTKGLGEADLDLLALDLRDELARIAANRCGAGLDGATEERVCRCCYALALYEQFFRTLAARQTSPLLQLGFDASVEDVLALAPPSAVDDLAAMAQLLCDRQPNLVAQSAILNPTFDGSLDVGGADADVIAERTLIEFKTTRQDSFERVGHVYQLLGYVLLDYSDEYGIESVAVYLARRGLFVQWKLSDILEMCCDTNDLAALRRDFRRLVWSEAGL